MYETTVFDSTGLAIQDIACAAEIYRKYATSATDLRQLGLDLPFRFHFF